jgi:hypothetical protein
MFDSLPFNDRLGRTHNIYCCSLHNEHKYFKLFGVASAARESPLSHACGISIYQGCLSEEPHDRMTRKQPTIHTISHEPSIAEICIKDITLGAMTNASDPRCVNGIL